MRTFFGLLLVVVAVVLATVDLYAACAALRGNPVALGDSYYYGGACTPFALLLGAGVKKTWRG